MKKFLVIISVFLLVFSMQACSTDDGDETIEITFKQNKPEIDDQLQAYAKAYEAETGVKVNVVSCGGDACNLGDMIRSDYAAKTMPEIFPVDGVESFNEWKELAADLSDEKWVDDTEVEFLSEGKVYGFPVSVEGWGMAYNADLLEKAEIDPATLTNYAAYEEAFKKIEGMKAELGVKSAVSMVAGPGMYWVTAHHNFNGLLANGLKYGDMSVVEAMQGGNIDATRLGEYTDWVKLLFDYADDTVLNTGGYGEQVNAFLNQEAVFLHQGNWVDGDLGDATFKMAFAPHGSQKAVTDGIFVGAPAWYIVNKESENAQAAKDFLEFMVYNELGQKYMVEEAGMIPAFTNITLQPKGQLSQSVMEWSKQNKIYAWLQYTYSGAFRDDTLGPIYNLLASGEVELKEFNERMTTALEDYE
jgi:raffinose/stachyose/melibiose transport system substrate-binding protein